MSNFDVITKNIQTGDILLSRKPGSKISEIIQGVTRSKWSHSFLYIGENKIIESGWDGVVIRHLADYFNGKYELGLFRVQPELTVDEQSKLVKTARKMLGIHYGFLQLLWGAILRLFGKSEDPDWNINMSKGMICSEMMARAFKRINRPIKDLPPAQMEPVDFDDSSATIRIA